ncbi:uncharacterized protein ARMOST_04597 [Armillaria ostoyae]|uniref:Uncharacterized protein n=1 Tax=Armillaria ostoyae TaxID=47428 RepID=A0A284QXT7_ARMOS|nr:uncharacterized protein ARMOST_04597 [Armillaria ostoyae]
MALPQLPQRTAAIEHNSPAEDPRHCILHHLSTQSIILIRNLAMPYSKHRWSNSKRRYQRHAGPSAASKSSRKPKPLPGEYALKFLTVWTLPCNTTYLPTSSTIALNSPNLRVMSVLVILRSTTCICILN